MLKKVPGSAWKEIKSWLNAIYIAPNLETGEKLAADFIARYKDAYPRAVAAFWSS